ncbi:MAG: hypothetical protein QNL87_11780 [Gammaproteobacteria bacterium]|nr:hypothetical protein [Gammaproteobacteria bacterium]
MTKAPNKLFLSIAILCTACMLLPAHAEQTLARVTAPNQFTIQLPDVNREALIEQVRELRSQLIQRKQALAQIIADKKLDSSDAFITTIMPGGLIYAGYKKVRYEQAKNELASVTADIEEFSGDLLAMQPESAPVAVARLH